MRTIAIDYGNCNYSIMWKPIAVDPRYSVSLSGKIKRNSSDRVLKPWKHKSGHLYVKLNKKYQVHHLVLDAFVGKRPRGLECRHIDGNPTNNRASNLVWGTRAQNIEDYRILNGKHFRASIKLKKAKQIRCEFTGLWGDQVKLAKKYKISPSIINRIIKNQIYL